MTKQEKVTSVYGFKSDLIEAKNVGIEPDCFGEYETRNYKDGYYEWRPKSLQGIEDNNS